MTSVMRWMIIFLPAIAVASACPAIGAEDAAIVEPFVIRSGGVAIAGEVRSLSPKRCIAVIAVGGSNVRTRADTAQAIPFFLDAQTAVVLMDRRGNGLSTGRFEVPDTKNTAWQIPRFGRDVAAVAWHLKRQGFRRVVIAGTSMGGWINNSAAAAAPNAIDAVVSINGGAVSVGVSDEFDRLAASGLDLVAAADKARTYRGPQGYDPRRDLARVRQPTLWVFGAKDRSNPSTLDLASVKQLAARGKPFRWMLLPNADHEFIDATTKEFDASWVEPVRSFIRGSAPCA